MKLGFEGLFVVELVGLSGGLALIWNEAHELEIQNYTRRHINALVKHEEIRNWWKLTCFYDHPIMARRHESWSLLELLKHFQL